MDLIYITNWGLGRVFDTSDLRSSEYSKLQLLLLSSNNLYLNIVCSNEPLYLV